MQQSVYQLERCSWDITDRCPLNCAHCCAKKDTVGPELTHTEALSLVRQLIALRVRSVSLTGGEPLVREDWPEIVRALSDGGVQVSLTTSGWTLDAATVGQMRYSGLHQAAISVDGPRDVHDQIRQPGSYDRFVRALQYLQAVDIPVTVITTVLRTNLDRLPQLRNELVRLGVKAWQLQLGVPVGNLKQRPQSVLDPRQMGPLIDFCYETAQSYPIRVFPADGIGYYTQKDALVRKHAMQSDALPVWRGCIGGKRLAHITSDGNVLGISMAVFEGDRGLRANIRQRSLEAIWNDDRVFAEFRKFDCTQLEGLCRTCQYRDLCKGGCTMVRLSLGGGRYAENPYCAYYQARREKQAISYVEQLPL